MCLLFLECLGMDWQWENVNLPGSSLCAQFVPFVQESSDFMKLQAWLLLFKGWCRWPNGVWKSGDGAFGLFLESTQRVSLRWLYRITHLKNTINWSISHKYWALNTIWLKPWSIERFFGSISNRIFDKCKIGWFWKPRVVLQPLQGHLGTSLFRGYVKLLGCIRKKQHDKNNKFQRPRTCFPCEENSA